MQNKSIWFDSPLPKLAPLPALRQPEADPEDSHFAKPHQYSPDPLPSDRFQPQPLSPWSSLVDADHDHKCAHLSLPGLFPGRQQEVIEERLVYSEEEEEDLATPQRRGEQCGESEEEGELHTTGRKSQFEQRQRIRKPRPRDKGLRKLSEKAFEIVRDMRNATYKDVACRLVQEISEEDLQGENREEQNIKRRVYDALNVLIALGVLRKDGRKIISQKDFKTTSLEDAGSEEIDKLKEKIAAKESNLANKQMQLREVEDRFLSITTLLRRNREARHRRQTVIAFPFVGIVVEKEEEEQTQHSSAQEVIIRTVLPIQPFGDIDSLKWLKQLQTHTIDGYIA